GLKKLLNTNSVIFSKRNRTRDPRAVVPPGLPPFLPLGVLQMMEKILSRSIRVICLGGMTLGMHAAYAQQADQPMQRVEVTGSRIRAVDLETAQPVQVMTQEQIQKSGLVTVGDILNNLSSAGAPDF